MSGSYNGGNTVITIRRSDKDMARRTDYWQKKRVRAQAEFDAANAHPDPQDLENSQCQNCRKVRPAWKMVGTLCTECSA